MRLWIAWEPLVERLETAQKLQHKVRSREEGQGVTKESRPGKGGSRFHLIRTVQLSFWSPSLS